MQQTVYVDLYFLINFSMDLLCLMITASLLHRPTNRIRAILAAAFGGAYAVAALLLNFHGILGFSLDILAALVLCLITFAGRKQSPWRLFQPLPILLLTSMTLGGVMTAAYSWLNRLNLPFESLKGDGISVWSFALLTAVAGVATLRGGRFTGISKKTKSLTVEATLFGQAITLRAMVDSGNLLRDPVSGKSVIVADVDRLAPILPPSLVRACKSGSCTDWLSSHEHAKLTRPIPVSTATGKSLLLGIVPEHLTLTADGKSCPADYLIAPAQLGNHALGFDAIVPQA